jgi:hypothetical protein
VHSGGEEDDLDLGETPFSGSFASAHPAASLPDFAVCLVYRTTRKVGLA